MDLHAKCVGLVVATAPIHPFFAPHRPTTPKDVNTVLDSKFVAPPPKARNYPARIRHGRVPPPVRRPAHSHQFAGHGGRFHFLSLTYPTVLYPFYIRAPGFAGNHHLD